MPAEQVHRRGNDDVTLAEVNRNVVALGETMQTFAAEVRSTLLRKDVYLAEKATQAERTASQDLRIKQLEEAQQKADDNAAANRRLAVSGLILPLLVAILAAVILAGLP